MRELVLGGLAVFSLVVSVYFVCWNTPQVLMSPMAGLYLWRHRHRYRPRARALAQRHVNPPVLSIVMPAYN